MIYFSPSLNEFYLFEKEGRWDEQTINHPKLHFNRLFDEKANFISDLI
jgi:hypothetical protein